VNRKFFIRLTCGVRRETTLLIAIHFWLDDTIGTKRTMKFVVLGATGGTGLELIRRAVALGHSVTAFARSTDRLREFSDFANALYDAESKHVAQR
jgi:D-arabinose 1-dehydrogenase-like Zn-dependent alcohol dehydrogenase